MKLSKKKESQINEALTQSFLEVLEEFGGKHRIGGTLWYNTPPDMWSKEERELFDAMTEFQNKSISKIKAIYKN